MVLGVAVAIVAVAIIAISAGSFTSGGGVQLSTSEPVPTVADGGSTGAPGTTATTLESVPPASTTTTSPPRTTTTISAPATTSTIPHASGLDADHARIYVENQYATAVTVGAGDETGNTWVLEPGQKAGPWDMLTSTSHGDGASVARVDDSGCGSGDGEDYFQGGHVYRLVVKTRSTNCTEGPGPELYIYDLTAATTRTI
jgi:hypothetical protein